jgi:hypothetical protein
MLLRHPPAGVGALAQWHTLGTRLSAARGSQGLGHKRLIDFSVPNFQLLESTEPRFMKSLHITSLKCPGFEVESVPLKETDMKRSRFNEEQIIGILKEQEAACRRQAFAANGVSGATFYIYGLLLKKVLILI